MSLLSSSPRAIPEDRIRENVGRQARRLHALIDAISYAVFSMSADWGEMREMKGAGLLADASEPDRDWLDRYIPKEDQPHVLERIADAMRTQEIADLTHRVLRADGSSAWVHSRAVPILNDDGHIEEWFGVLSDITAKQEADEARSRLSAIVASAEDAIVGKDLEGRVSSWNPGAERIFGYRAEEMIGQSIRRLIPNELQTEEDGILSKLRRGERLEHFETTRVRKDGTRIQVSITVSPIRDSQGRVIGASKIARDVSERRRKDEPRFLLASVVDSSDDAIVSKDLTSTVTSWNPAATRLFGYTAAEMIGRSIRTIIPSELQNEEDMILEKIRAGERIEHFETVRRRKDGERIEVSATISPVRDDTGKIIGASKIARDISERRKIQNLLVQSEKLAATGRMAATVAHELNNPLEAITNLVYLARVTSEPDAVATRYLADAERELQRAAHITRQTLGFYRDTTRPVPVSMDQMLDELLSIYETRLTNAGISVERDYRTQDTIVANRGELVQVFSNLVANAIDAMPHGGMLRLRVGASEAGERPGVDVAVEDTGGGIAPEHLQRLFEPFFTTKGDRGNGIGLWISRQIVEKHGGTMQVESVATGDKTGTTVSVFLPKLSPDKS